MTGRRRNPAKNAAPVRPVGRDLLRVVEEVRVGSDTLDEIDRVIAERRAGGFGSGRVASWDVSSY